ncbi:MAG: BamA/TamA family outer membrane protein [Anditalea sp.]
MKITFLLFMCFFGHGGIAQEDARKDTLNESILIDKLFDTADDMVGLFSGKSWTFIPAVTYSPETSLGLGVRALRIFRDSETLITRPSTMPITFLYTLKKQIVFTTALDIWMNENADNLKARIELTDYPFKFYGIGNELLAENEESYATRYVHFQLEYQKLITPGLYLGPKYEFRADDIYQTETGGLLGTNQVSGSDGQRISGIGLVLNYDTRNNIFQPDKGSFHQVSVMSFQPFLGSNFTFSQYQLDFRKYIKVYDHQILAVQAWYSFTAGHPPFQHVSLIGGSDLMRGYFEGRYRDLHAMAYQAEYRLPIYRNLGLVLFGSAGQVAEKVTSYAINRFKYGGGLGFRYKFSEEGLSLRVDIAFGDQAAFYFGLNEVF